MPRNYKRNSFKRYSRSNKWRQQKLAIGTVKKIARNIAKKVCDKKTRYYYSNIFHARDGFNWDSVTEICPNNAYRPVHSGAMESQVMSDVSGLVLDAGIFASVTEQKNVTVAVKAVQCRISVRNPNVNAVKVTAAIIFIPNLNEQTDDAVDFLRPDVFILYKQGGGNLLYDGFAKRGIMNKATSAASVRNYKIIVSKTFTIRGTIHSGTGTTYTTPNLYTRTIPNVARKNFFLTKYFKRERKHNCKFGQGAQQFTDGNYYFIMYSDISLDDEAPAQPRLISYCGASSIKLRVVGTTDALTT